MCVCVYVCVCRRLAAKILQESSFRAEADESFVCVYECIDVCVCMYVCMCVYVCVYVDSWMLRYCRGARLGLRLIRGVYVCVCVY